MPRLPVERLVGGELTPPEAAERSFWLDGAAWELPTFDNAAVFVARLERAGLLVRDPVVEATLAGRPPRPLGALGRAAGPARERADAHRDPADRARRARGRAAEPRRLDRRGGPAGRLRRPIPPDPVAAALRRPDADPRSGRWRVGAVFVQDGPGRLG
jgi:hypothetical protein